MNKTIFSKEYRLFLDLLKKARTETGVTQTQLAQRMKVTQTFISKCERGERRLDIVEIKAWCKALDVPFSSFVAAFERTTKKES